MNTDNQANRLRKEVLIRVVRALCAENPREALSRIPLQMRPRTNSATRCCVHKDRAVIRYRCLAALGFRAEDDHDELLPIGAFLEKAVARESSPAAALSVIDEACSACVKTSYTVTNACRGCVARACHAACPRDAIRFSGGRAELDAERCVNCGLCLKACPYHAIIRVPIPCEEACPVDAISRSEISGREEIDRDRCISCGRCLRDCPFAAITETSQLSDVLRHLRGSRRTVAMLAPSVAGQLPGSFAQLVEALHRLGFAAVMEVAEGAERTARHEATEVAERLAEGESFVTSSCCPAYVQAVNRHLPQMRPHLSETPTPMGYTAAEARRHDGDAVTVFIGPCLAKRCEAADNPDVSYVLTFEELAALFIGCGIDVPECDESAQAARGDREAHGFAASGGVIRAVEALTGAGCDLKTQTVDGLDRKTLSLMKSWTTRGCGGNFIEVMSCHGGCIAGPGTIVPARLARRQLNDRMQERPTMAPDATGASRRPNAGPKETAA